MKNLMETNVYDVSDEIIIVGTCLKNMQPKAFKELTKLNAEFFELCLENTHINMAITKLAGMISRVKIKKVIFATVDKSPHCIQLHYIESELKKIMKLDNVKFEHYVAVDDKLVEISTDIIKISKSLYELQKTLK